MKEKDKKIISEFLKYLACALAVIFLIYGLVRHFSSGKKTETNVPEEKASVEKNGQGGKSWVDEIGDEKKALPEAEMSPISQDAGLSGTRRKFLECARKYIGTPYRYGGADSDGMDCSGFVYAVALETGLGKVPKSSKGLCDYASPVQKGDLIPGDLVFFERDGSIFHVAVYAGENKLIHAISDGPATGVGESSLDEPYWSEHFHSCGRIMAD